MIENVNEYTTKVLFTDIVSTMSEEDAVIASLFAIGNVLGQSARILKMTKINESNPEIAVFLNKQGLAILEASKTITERIEANQKEDIEANKELSNAMLNNELKGLLDLLATVNVDLPDSLK